MFLSVFELFKIGIGPSSSHTMGPMTAANMFLQEIIAKGFSCSSHMRVSHIRVYLHGSLAFTGVGHATDKAIILGLLGEKVSTVDPNSMGMLLEKVKHEKKVQPIGHSAYHFDLQNDLIFEQKKFYLGMLMVLHLKGLILMETSSYGGFIILSVAVLW